MIKKWDWPYRNIWKPVAVSKIQSSSKKNFRGDLTRSVRRQCEKVEQLELELSELRMIVEDLMRDDMRRLSMHIAGLTHQGNLFLDPGEPNVSWGQIPKRWN